ncbi:MAG: glycosyltransferase family 2 protein [Bacillota bacterium]
MRINNEAVKLKNKINNSFVNQECLDKRSLFTSDKYNIEKFISSHSDLQIKPFTIIIPFSREKINELMVSLSYYNKCLHIDKCEILLICYENNYIEYNFNIFNNINYRIIRSKRNNKENKFNLSHCKNIGFKNSLYDWVAFLDCDIKVPEIFCCSLFFYQNNPNISYWARRININKYTEKSKNILSSYLTVEDGPLGFFGFYHKDTIFSKLGGYDEKMYGWGFEDIDFIHRSKLAGIIYRKIDDFDVYHNSHEYNNNWKCLKSKKNNSDIYHYHKNNKIIKIKKKIGKIIKHMQFTQI